MEVAPFEALLWSAAIAIPLVVWMLWLAGRRLADPAVSAWEKGSAIAAVAAGSALCIAGFPEIGIYPVVAGPALLLVAASIDRRGRGAGTESRGERPLRSSSRGGG